jgi:hypothetical protein
MAAMSACEERVTVARVSLWSWIIFIVTGELAKYQVGFEIILEVLGCELN